MILNHMDDYIKPISELKQNKLEPRYNFGRFCNSVEGLFYTFLKIIFLSIGLSVFMEDGKERLIDIAKDYINENIEDKEVESEILNISKKIKEVNSSFEEFDVVNKLAKKLYIIVKECK